MIDIVEQPPQNQAGMCMRASVRVCVWRKNKSELMVEAI